MRQRVPGCFYPHSLYGRMANGPKANHLMKGNKTITGPAMIVRLKTELALKLVLLVALNLWVYVPYLFLQRHQFFPATMMRPGVLDQWIPFLPQTVWIYLSI